MLWMPMEATKEGSHKILGPLIMGLLGRLMGSVLRIVSFIPLADLQMTSILRFLLLRSMGAIKPDLLMPEVEIIARLGRLMGSVLHLRPTEPTIHGIQTQIYISWMLTVAINEGLQIDMALRFI